MPAITDLFGAVVPGQPEPLATDQPRPGRGPKDWAKAAPLLAMLPLVLKKGGPQGLAVFLGSLEAAKQQKAQQAQLEAEKQAQAQRQQMLDQRTFANDAFTQRGQMFDRQRAFLNDFSSKLQAATTPEEAAQLVQTYGQFGQGVGVQPAQLDAIAKAVASEEKLTQRRVESFLKQADKDQIDQWIQARGSLMVDGKPVPFERWSKYVPSAVDAQGQPIVAPKADETPNTDYGRFLARFAADRGKTFSQLTVAEEAEARKMYGQADDRPPAPRDSSVQDARRFSMEQRLVAQWDKANAPMKEMRRQLGLMQTGLRRFRAGDRNGGAQAVLVTFQKILDPTSVVRESEYARTASGQSLINRIQGFTERLSSGGAGLTDAEMAAMVQTAAEFMSGMDSFNSGLRRRLEATAQEYQLDPRMIFDDVDVPAAPSGRPTAPGANPFRR